MKWFKMEGWREHNEVQAHEGGVPDMGTDWDLAGYTAHLESIAPRLPAELLDACSMVHDSSLVSMHTDLRAKRLDMLVLTARGHEHWVFEGAEYVRWVNNMMSLPGPPGFGDMGYEELDIDDNGRMVVRILFSSGLELHVAFTGFRLSVEEPSSSV